MTMALPMPVKTMPLKTPPAKAMPPSAVPPEAVRVRMASAAGTAGGMLAALARDPAVTVRAALALNPSAPPAAQTALACDEDDRVRALLARRLAALMPRADGAALSRQSVEILSSLAADEAVRVRAAIADVAKEMPDAPRELILQLAQDAAVVVARPVLRLSPVLTTEDLLTLIAGSSLAARHIAERAGLPEAVSDAVAATADGEAIGALLANRSAQIREATLDALVAGAAAEPAWHEPLARRPALSARSAVLLSSLISDELLRAMAMRTDLPAGVMDELRVRLRTKLDGTEALPAAQEMADAQALRQRGALDEAALMDAARCGKVIQAGARLAVAAGVPYAAVERAVAMQSGKALVSLAWKAGFSMRAGLAAQAVLAQLGPGQLLHAREGGTFPLAVEEMRFQLEFLGRGT